MVLAKGLQGRGIREYRISVMQHEISKELLYNNVHIVNYIVLYT